jgi:DNA repair exonuclease SbcCD ATPase subunit
MARLAKLTYRTPEGEAREVTVSSDGEVVVGRHPECAINITQPSVSRRHARFWFDADDGRFYIEDKGSSNGSFVNNQRVTRAALSSGEEIRCGDFKLAFIEVAAEPAAPPGPRLVGTLRPQRLPDGSVPRRPGSVPPSLPGSPVPVGPPAQQADAGRAQPITVRPGAAPSPAATPTAPRPVATLSANAAGPRAVGPLPPTGATPTVDLSAEVVRLRAEVEQWKSAAAAAKASNTADANSQLAASAQASENLRAELEVQKIHLERAKIEAATATSDKVKAESELTELRQDLQDKAKRVSDLERAVERGREQAETQAERSVQLTKQIQTQQTQLEEYRREKVDLEMQLAEATHKLGLAQGSLDSGAGREADLVNQINDLKREVRQKEKGEKDTLKQLEVSEYNLRVAREEIDNLKLALGEDDGQRRGLNTKVEDLAQVVAEKEAIIEALQFEISKLTLRAEQKDAEVQATVAEQTARARADFLSEKETLLRQAQQLNQEASKLRQQVAQAQVGNTQVAALEQRAAVLHAETQTLRAALAEAEARALTGPRQQQEQLNDLRRANRELRNELEALQQQPAPTASAAGEADAQALAELRRLFEQAQSARRTAEVLKERAEAELKALKDAAPATPTASVSGAGGDYAHLRTEAVQVYETINDVAAELRNQVSSALNYLDDLRGAVEVAEQTAADASAGAARDRAAKFVQASNPRLALEDTEAALSALQEAADAFRRTLRSFREVLNRHGYGS